MIDNQNLVPRFSSFTNKQVLVLTGKLQITVFIH